MASRNAFLLSLLAFSLTLPFLTPHCGSQSDSPHSGGPGSEEGTASGRVFLVAPEKEDCDGTIPCDTVTFYSQNYVNGLSDAIFYFLPGNHTLSQRWNMSYFSNVTICGRSRTCFGEHHSIRKGEVEVHGSIGVAFSELVVVENITIKHCPSDWCLGFASSVGITVRNVAISHCTETGILALDCENMTITQSKITDCIHGMVLNGYMSIETSHLFLSRMVTSGIVVGVSEGTVTFNHVRVFEMDNDGLRILSHYFFDVKNGFTVKRHVAINILNTTVTSSERVGILLFFRKLGNTRLDINIESVSIATRIKSGSIGIQIDCGYSDYDAVKMEVSVRIHNVTITGLSDGCVCALLATSFRNLTVSDTTIKSNPCTAIILVQSTVLFQRNVLLTNNRAAAYGGGIRMSLNSLIVLDLSTKLQLHNNTAEKYGGGIYVYTTVFPVYCFAISIGGTTQPAIEFDGNRAYGSGHNLYGRNRNDCVPPPFHGKDYKVIETFGKVESKCNQTVISSDPLQVVPCDGFCINVTLVARDQHLPPIYPGQEFNLTLAAIGVHDGLTPAIILFRSNDILFVSKSHNMTKSVKARCTTVSLKLILKKFTSQATVHITIPDERLSNAGEDTNSPVVIHVHVLSCPPGFTMSESICNCIPSLDRLATCDITNRTIKRKGNSWISPMNDSVLIFENCPFDYCNNEVFASDHPSEQCNYERSGTLCGDCLPGYSLTLGSNKCRNCTEHPWQTTPVIIVLVSCVAGIGLVAALIALNLTVSVGTMNGLLFFVNVVKLYEPSFRWDQVHRSFRYVISWLNLDLGIPTCFYSGMTACHKIGLQFAFPTYLLSMVVVIIVVCNLGQCRGFSSFRFVRFISGKASVLIGSKAVTVLATLLLLSYTKILCTTIQILHSATVIVTDCDENKSSPACENLTVWYVNGSMAYRSDCHGILFWVAVGIFAPFLILFTSFLLFFPLMEKHLSRFRCWISWHMRLKPWYDAYGGPYKDEYRSWTGVLLVVRCLLALFTAFENNPLDYINVLAYVCLFLISLVSVTMVYKKLLLNALEIIYLACLLIIAFFTKPPDEESAEANVVLWIALSSLLLVASYHIYHFLKERPLFQRLALKAKNIYENFRKGETEEDDMDDNCDANARTVPSTVVSIYSDRYDELREPLLEPDP